MKKYLILLCIAFTPGLKAQNGETSEKDSSLPAWMRARPLTIPGETSHLYLVPDGFTINPFINDLWGDTDKLLTGGNNFRYSTSWGVHSFIAGVNWRFFVPAAEPKHGVPKLEDPPGHYADWIAASLAWSRPLTVWDENFKLGLNVGLGHIGNHGAAKIHSLTHDLVRAKKDGLEYTNQPTGYKKELGFEIGWVPKWKNPLCDSCSLMISAGLYAYTIIYERWVSFDWIFQSEGKPKFTIETRLLNPYSSETMSDDIRHFRAEISFGWYFNDYYTPNLVVVSPYVKRDPYPQLYINLALFNLPVD